MPAGRPTKYSDDMLLKAIDYIKNNEDVIPTVVGLRLHMGISKATLNRWVHDENKEGIKDVVEHVLDLQERQLIAGGLTSEYNSQVTKMLLAQHGYSDRVEQDVTSGGKVLNTWVVNPVTTDKDG